MSNTVMIRKADEGGYILNIQGSYGTKEVVCLTFGQVAKRIFDSVGWEKVGDKVEIKVLEQEDKDPPQPTGEELPEGSTIDPHPQVALCGPEISIQGSCRKCKYCVSKYYVNQGDSGYTTQCASFPSPRDIGDNEWRTPGWCPSLKAYISGSSIPSEQISTLWSALRGLMKRKVQ